MMTDDMNAEFRARLAVRSAREDMITAKRAVLRAMLSERRQKIVDHLEGAHRFEHSVRHTFARLSAETTLILIALESCE